MYAVMEELISDHVPVDVVTLAPHIGGDRVMASILAMTESVPTSANIEHYARQVADGSARRATIETARRMMARAQDPQENMADVIGDSTTQLAQLLDRTARGRPEQIGAIAGRVLKQFESIEEKGAGVGASKTGFAVIDKELGGIDHDNLVILGARPSMGKTGFAIQLARNFTKSSGYPTLFFSFETRKESLVRRVFAQDSRVPLQSLRAGVRDVVHWTSIRRTAIELEGEGLWIDDTKGSSVAEVRAKVRSKAYVHGQLGGVVIDYLQKVPTDHHENRDVGLGQVTTALKYLAEEINAPVVVLSQLNREVEKRHNQRPVLSDLRESGNIEQDADVVWFLHRENYYSNSAPADEAELIVAKTRDGPARFTLPLRFEPEFVRFS